MPFKDECGVFGIFGHPGGRQPHLPWPLRASASRAGERRHRLGRRREAPHLPRDGAGRRRVQRGHACRRFPATSPSGTRATRRPAKASSRTRNHSSSTARTARSPWPQRQSGQRDGAARRAGPRRVDLSDEQRHRSHPPSLRALESVGGRRGDHRVDCAGPRRVLARPADEEPADRRARSARVPPARARPPRRRLDRLLRDVRARPDRRAPTCATSSPASCWSSATADCGRSSRSRRSRSRIASSSTSTSRGPTATSSAAASTRSAPISGASSRAKRRAGADVVVPIPDSGVCAAIGFAEEAGLPMKMGLIRNHYIGRTFIQPQQSIRHFNVRVKLNPVRSILEGKRVILLDDSIVRGTTSRKIVKMVKAAGASEVHLRISCPPTVSPCFYGVDTPEPRRADRGDAYDRRDPRSTSRPTAWPI